MHCRCIPSMLPKSLFGCKPCQMEQENQMAQETSLCAKKQQMRRVQRPKAFPELAGHSQGNQCQKQKRTGKWQAAGKLCTGSRLEVWFLSVNVFFSRKNFTLFITFSCSAVLFSQIMRPLCCFTYLPPELGSPGQPFQLWPLWPQQLLHAFDLLLFQSPTWVILIVLLFLLLGWKARMTVSLLWTPSLLITDAFIHPLTIIGAPPAALNLSPHCST